MLTCFRTSGFRALRDVEVRLAREHPTVLIGPNATGKTSLLESLEFLRILISSNLTKALDRHQNGSLLWRAHQIPMTFELSLELDDVPPLFKGSPLVYRLALVREQGGPVIQEEELFVSREGRSHPLLLRKPGASIVFEYKGSFDDPVERNWKPTREQPLLTVLGSLGGHEVFSEVVRAIEGLWVYQGFHVGPEWRLNPRDRRAPGEMIAHVERLDQDGRNLFNALYTLHDAYPDAWRELKKDFSACFSVDLSFKLPRGERGTKYLEWQDQRIPNAEPFYFGDMSEGMLTALCQLAALHAQDAPSLLAFDEPDAHLHPRLLRRIVGVMENRAKRTPILLTTHSDRLLDFLEDPADSLRISGFNDERGTVVEELNKDALRGWLEDFSASTLRARHMLDPEPEPPDDEAISGLVSFTSSGNSA